MKQVLINDEGYSFIETIRELRRDRRAEQRAKLLAYVLGSVGAFYLLLWALSTYVEYAR